MTQPETGTLDAALVEALGVLRVGTDEDKDCHAPLSKPILVS